LEEAGKVLIMRSGSDYFGLDLRAVQEIIYQPDITSLPQGSGFITGVCRWQQKQIPVIDIGLYLGNLKASRSGCLVMVVISGMEEGLLVEEVGSIVDLPLNKLISVDKNLDREQGKIFKAFEFKEKIVYILDPQALIKHL